MSVTVLSYWFFTFVPKVEITTMITAAMAAIINAYSTAVAPP